MRNSNTILEMMLGDHALIESFLINFKDNLSKGIELVEKSFDEFNWALEKHMFVEEKVMFKFCDSLTSEICKIVQGLTKDHDSMLEMLNEIRNMLVINKEIDISNFQEFLMDHKRIEETTLYPKLDQILNKEQKEIMIAQINEIPLEKEINEI
jgi:hemerythrin superfamily protein